MFLPESALPPWRQVATASEQWLAGTDGWFFLHHDSNHSLEYSQGQRGWPAATEAAWQNLLAERADWCRAHGSGYGLLLAPNKEVVYPDFLPGLGVPTAQRPAMRLAAWGQEVSAPCPVVYPLAALQAPWADGRTSYPRTETHWDFGGAWRALQAIAPWWQKVPGARSLDEADIDWQTEPLLGDLGRKCQPPQHSQCVVPCFAPGVVQPRVVMNRYHHQGARCLHTRWPGLPSGEGGRLLLLGDSFSLPLLPFLARVVPEVLFVHTPRCDRALIERFRPHQVVQQMVERFLHRLPDDQGEAPQWAGLLSFEEGGLAPRWWRQRPAAAAWPAGLAVRQQGSFLRWQVVLTLPEVAAATGALFLLAELPDGTLLAATPNGWLPVANGASPLHVPPWRQAPVARGEYGVFGDGNRSDGADVHPYLGARLHIAAGPHLGAALAVGHCWPLLVREV